MACSTADREIIIEPSVDCSASSDWGGILSSTAVILAIVGGSALHHLHRHRYAHALRQLHRYLVRAQRADRLPDLDVALVDLEREPTIDQIGDILRRDRAVEPRTALRRLPRDCQARVAHPLRG